MYEKSGPRPGDGDQPGREPWRFPPEDEVPAVVPVERFLVQNPFVVGFVPAAEVYSTGCVISTRFVVNRADRDEETWQTVCSRAVRRPNPYPPTSTSPEDPGLQVTVTTSNGATASTRDSVSMADRGHPAPLSGPRLAVHNVRSSSDRERAYVTADLWLWPLPPAGELSLSATWATFGLTPAVLTIDASPITEAATRVQHF